MAKKREGGEAMFASDGGIVQPDYPVDQTETWREIYRKLAGMIGADAASSWFGHAAFLGIRDGEIELAGWCSYNAKQALAEHGRALGLAAGVMSAKMHRYGGKPPHWLKNSLPSQKAGFEAYVLPRTKAPWSDAARALAAETITALANHGGAIIGPAAPKPGLPGGGG